MNSKNYDMFSDPYVGFDMEIPSKDGGFDINFTPSIVENWIPIENLSSKAHDKDYIVRVVQSTSRQFAIASLPTETLRERIKYVIEEKEKDIEILKEISAWLKHRLDYEGLFNAFNLGTISEKEFIDISAEFAEPFRDREESEVMEKVELLERLLPFQLSDSDLADFLDIQPTEITNFRITHKR